MNRQSSRLTFLQRGFTPACSKRVWKIKAHRAGARGVLSAVLWALEVA